MQSPTPMLIAASMLAADGGRLRDEAQAMAQAGADWLHLDVMDGHFVPNITFGPDLAAVMARATALYCDVHLMVQIPMAWLTPFARSGAHNLTVHAEATPHLPEVLGRIVELGCHAGVSINPRTPAQTIEHVLPLVDTVLVMSVEPGFGGQSYMPHTAQKVSYLRDLRQKLGLHFRLEVDGGINEKTIAHAAQAGADVCVAGSALFKDNDYKARVMQLRSAALGTSRIS